MPAETGHRWWHRFATLRARTTVVAALVVAVALAVGAFVLLALLERTLINGIDDIADVRAEDVAALARQGVLPRVLADPGDEDAGVQVVDGRGRVVSSTSNLEGAPRVARFVPPGADEEARTLRNVPGTLNDSVRVLALPTATDDERFTIYVITSLEPLWETISAVRHILLFGVPILFIVVALGAWVLVGRALRPVGAIRREVSAIGATDLARRVPEPATRDEIGLLAQTMNAMLARLERASDRERRFVGDASHELQSPLASIRSQIEVALRTARIDDSAGVLEALLEESARMEQLVQDLLFLARSDEDAPLAQPSPVDLEDVVLAEIARLPSHGPAIDTSGVSAAPLLGRRGDLSRLVRNLLDNARRHAIDRVTVAVRLDDGNAILVVGDDGSGVPTAERTRIFERFERLDDARAPSDGGTGLGLSIAREIAQQHGGRIDVETARPRGSLFVVQLPSR